MLLVLSTMWSSNYFLVTCCTKRSVDFCFDGIIPIGCFVDINRRYWPTDVLWHLGWKNMPLKQRGNILDVKEVPNGLSQNVQRQLWLKFDQSSLYQEIPPSTGTAWALTSHAVAICIYFAISVCPIVASNQGILFADAMLDRVPSYLFVFGV